MKADTIFKLIMMAGLAFVVWMVWDIDKVKKIELKPTEKIETRIEGKETTIHTIQEKVVFQKGLIDSIKNEFKTLHKELSDFKEAKDTFNIVRIQDTIIKNLIVENVHKDSVISMQDSIIEAQRYVINSKDTIITIGNHNIDMLQDEIKKLTKKNKRIKRQRNASIIGNLIQGAVIIFK